MWHVWLCNSNNILRSILFCTKSEDKTELDPSACSPSPGAWQQTAGCCAGTAEARQQHGMGEVTGRKNSNLALSSPPTELRVVPRGWSEWLHRGWWEAQLSSPSCSRKLHSSWGCAAALAHSTNLIGVSIFCWVLQHRTCKVTKEWQLKKFIFESSKHLEFNIMKQKLLLSILDSFANL